MSAVRRSSLNLAGLRAVLAALAIALASLLPAVPGIPAVGVAHAAGAQVAPGWLEAEIPKARLGGSGTFRYFGLAIYDADFWVGPNGFRTTAPTAERFALDLHYARALEGKQIARRSADEMKKLGLGTDDQRAAWLVKMEALFPDVQEGSRITGINLPQQGARFYRDGKLLGEVADPAFAAAFFAIWLDPKTTGGKLREALLADAAPR